MECLDFIYDSEMEIASWVRAARKHAGMTQEGLGEMLGLTKGNVSAWENKRHDPSINQLLKISQLTGYPLPKEIAGGTISNVEAGPEMRGRVPLISFVQAGAWCEAADPYNVGDAEDWFACPVSHGPRTYALRVRGESMHNPGGTPSFTDGDIIFVDPDREAVNKSLAIARLEESYEATFKRLLIDNGRRFLEALNPSWPNRIFEIREDARICGVVIARLESFI